jgi:hypothetical protein
VLILDFCLGFELFLLFSWFYRFSCLLLAFAVFLLLDDILNLFIGFWSSNCDSWGHGFRLCAFFDNGLINGEIEKPSDQFFGLIVMSH